jgi:hypothetical protein
MLPEIVPVTVSESMTEIPELIESANATEKHDELRDNAPSILQTREIRQSTVSE